MSSQAHFDKYETMAQSIGVAVLIEAVPFSVERIRLALANGDEHLNSLPLSTWDAAVGHFHFGNKMHWPEKKKQQCCPTCGQKAPLQTKRMTDREFVRHKPFERGPHSIAERVCLLKHVAIHHMANGGE